MARFRGTQSIPLQIRELAVDPADVDRETYPVRLRLTRSLTPNESRALASVAPEAHPEGDVMVIQDARLDDVAHAHGEWMRRLETVERIAEELEGEDAIAAQRRDDDRRVAGSHLGDRHDPYTMG